MPFDWKSILGGLGGGLLGLGVGSGFLTNPNRWMTPSEHQTRRQYEDIYGRLGPTAWEKPEWIADWGQSATAGAQESYQQALSAALARIAPPIAERNMWGSPGVRGALGIEAAKPLQRGLTRQLMGIDTEMAGMYGKAEMDWQMMELKKLLAQMGLTGQMGQLGVSGSDIFGGLAGLAGSGMQAWGMRGKGGG